MNTNASLAQEPKLRTRTRAVLKFGSSILRSPDDLARVCGEIYRQSQRFDQVIVTVSAYEGETNALIDHYEAICACPSRSGLADVVSMGEEKTAAQVKAACIRLGLDPVLLRPEQWAIIAEGPTDAAVPKELAPLPPSAWDAPIIIIPGYVALNPDHERVLLGRGGTDFSAIFLGGELNADCVRLYKDVDGVYECDPADGRAPAWRYDKISWENCLEIARPLLQPIAVEYAKAKNLTLEVGAIGSGRPTLVGPQSESARRPAPTKPIKIALAGFGVVGQALFKRLEREPLLQVTNILVRDRFKERAIKPTFPLCDELDRFLQTDADVFVDVTTGEAAGLPVSLKALRSGAAVVSANKTVVQPHFRILEQLVSDFGGYFGKSACVGGGTPMLEFLAKAESQGRVVKIEGVLNGTVNFLLDKLAGGFSMDDATTLARQLGFAEEDSSQDLSGRDAAIKLRLLAEQAFSRADFRDFSVEELTPELAKKIAQSDGRWYQLATVAYDNDGLDASIAFVPEHRLIDPPELPAERNFLRVTLDTGRQMEIAGRGAGGAPTAEAIVSDLIAYVQRLETAAQ